MDFTRRSPTPVLDWRIGDSEPDQGSVTGRLTKECVSVFRWLMKRLPEENITKGTLRSLERSCSSLILWDSGYSVAEGGLDDVLGRSRTLSRSILELLVSISRALIDHLKNGELDPHYALIIVSAEAEMRMHEVYQDSSDIDDSDSSSSSASLSSDWNEIAEDIWTNVQCLHDLNRLIKFPPLDPVRPSRDTPVEWQPHSAYTDRIKFRFPTADPDLVDRLARANLERFQKGKADRKKNHGAGIKSDEAEKAIAQHTEPVSKLHDSDISTSLNMRSYYAEAVMSHLQEGGESIKVPPLSKEAKRGKPFECVACGRMQNHREHLYLDLCPWVCHHLDCNFGNRLFQTRTDWIEHLGIEHGLDPDWESFACPMCHEDTGDGKPFIAHHLSSHMEEISMAALPTGVEADDETGSEKVASRESETRGTGESGEGTQIRWTRESVSTCGALFQAERLAQGLQKPRDLRKEELTWVQMEMPTQQQQHQDPAATLQWLRPQEKISSPRRVRKTQPLLRQASAISAKRAAKAPVTGQDVGGISFTPPQTPPHVEEPRYRPSLVSSRRNSELFSLSDDGLPGDEDTDDNSSILPQPSSKGETGRDHVLCKNATPQADGLFHCPWEGTPECHHRPEKLKSTYDDFVDSHLRPYRCKVETCAARFSSTASLFQHEREAHRMHSHDSHYCFYEGCERSREGKGFPSPWRLRDHLRRVHNDYGSGKTRGQAEELESKGGKDSQETGTKVQRDGPEDVANYIPRIGTGQARQQQKKKRYQH